ncbi:N-chimaerin-like isoform X2 [Lineus longissimus]|uniref:N-chimaerin-like isoform X2 n=1 Tax=Lineus longissimus TaxID=88925 RepID=UPI002B4FAAD8
MYETALEPLPAPDAPDVAKESFVKRVLRKLSTSTTLDVADFSEPQDRIDERPMDDDCVMPIWKSYLYHLQQQAPMPRRVVCTRDLPSKPAQYGREFHGALSREETDRLVSKCDGCYVVRESQRAPGTYTLAIRFEGITKNFKLYYDGQHYVGEKRFDTIHDLVADGLITFYLEAKASDYIAALSNESNYEESPYYRTKTKKQKELHAPGGAPQQLYQEVLDNRENLDRDPSLNKQSLAFGELDSADSRGATTNSRLDIKKYEKTHKFKVQNFKGPHWCDFCANFMWGLIAQGVKCQDCGFNAHKKCSEKVPNDCMPDMKFIKRCFGIDLTTLVKAQNTAIPVVVTMCIKEIESRGVDAEGLYRVAGFHDDVEAIKLAFDKDGENTDISCAVYEDLNTIGSVLKSYFRELPIPLVTFESYPLFIEAVRKDGLDQDERLQMVYHATGKLPPAHYQTLKYLMAHLGRVVEKQRVNMMSPENLAIVYAPTLLRSPDTDPLSSLTAAKYERNLMELMISHQDILFTQ